MATTIALSKTLRVLSMILLTMTFKYCGFRYGGNSKVKDDGSPFRRVLDKILDTNSVVKIPKRMIAVKKKTFKRLALVEKPTKNMVIIDIIAGNLPLQGTRLLVKIAIKRSLLESIILQPLTPTALQPKPIHIVKACLPQARHFLKHLSKLKAMRGR